MKLVLLACVLLGCGGDAFQAAAGDAGGHPSEGGTTDTGSPPVDAGASWCATQPTLMFCEDFDEYSTTTALFGSSTWTTHETSMGSFRFDTSGAPSAPNALEVTAGDGAAVLMVRTFSPVATTPGKARLEFDLRINQAGTPGLLAAVGFAAIAFGNGIGDGYASMAIGHGPTLEAFWTRSADAGAPGDAGTWGAAKAMAFPSLATWGNRYAIEVDYAQSCVQIYQGPSPQLSPCMPVAAELLARRVLSIALGDYAGGWGTVGQVDIEFDNVTFDAK